MCGIIGYCGPLDAQTVLLDGLTQLEYRGYDSAGIALFDENSKIHFIKKSEKLPLSARCARKIRSCPTAGSVIPAGQRTAASPVKTPIRMLQEGDDDP